MRRPIHYRSAGTHCVFYECYRLDLKAYLDKQAPHPISRTDVSQVTCPHCLFRLSSTIDRQIELYGDRPFPRP